MEKAQLILFIGGDSLDSGDQNDCRQPWNLRYIKVGNRIRAAALDVVEPSVPSLSIAKLNNIANRSLIQSSYTSGRLVSVARFILDDCDDKVST